ncbi:MAG: HlyD family secretion protein [Pirellulaceae bacterium]
MMSRTWILPLLSCGMILFAAQHIMSRQLPIKQQAPPLPTSDARFSECVAGSGIVEAEAENVRIGTHLPGIVAQVRVQAGDRVHPGDPLFVLDTRQIDAEIRVKRAELAVAQAELARLDQLPRPEDLPPMVAQRQEAEARVAEMRDAYERQQQLATRNATSTEQLVTSRERYQAARAQLDRMQAEEQRLRAGAWEADKAVSRATIARVEGELDKLQTERERHTVNVPLVDKEGRSVQGWQVLQANVRPGEAVTVASDVAVITLGAVDRKHVRVDVDEHDIPRFVPGARATGAVRGLTGVDYPLTFVRVEPYVIPKRSLTGDNTERVDTRVLQVIFRIDETDRPPVFVGQQMDVFIDSTE